MTKGDKAAELKKVERNLKKIKGKFKLASKTVAGEGNPNAKIMLLGEAPGQMEDKIGKPFVGRAGRKLNELLKIAGIIREKVFITGTVKFYPGTRAPNKKEIALCLPFTLRQIEIIKPKLIVLLGNVALNALIDKKLQMSKVHGKIFKRENKIYFPTFHPAAAMRFQKIMKQTEKDFRKLKILAKKFS